jgi:hypothetical protein
MTVQPLRCARNSGDQGAIGSDREPGSGSAPVLEGDACLAGWTSRGLPASSSRLATSRQPPFKAIIPGRDAIIRLVGGVLAEQDDEWTKPHRYAGLEILAACRKAAQTDMGQNVNGEAELTVEAVQA